MDMSLFVIILILLFASCADSQSSQGLTKDPAASAFNDYTEVHSIELPATAPLHPGVIEREVPGMQMEMRYYRDAHTTPVMTVTSTFGRVLLRVYIEPDCCCAISGPCRYFSVMTVSSNHSTLYYIQPIVDRSDGQNLMLVIHVGDTVRACVAEVEEGL